MSIINILLLVISFPFALIILTDIFFAFKEFSLRLKIGKWDNKCEWITAVKQINLRWLKKLPTVKLTDNNRYVLLDIIKRQYKSNTIQSWQEAGTLLGALYTENSKSKIEEFVNSKIDFSKGKFKTPPKHVDAVMLAYCLSKTSFNEKLSPIYKEVIQLIESHIGEDGTVFYRDSIKNIRFVDTIGFICPFLIFYGQQKNKHEYVDLALKQIKHYVEVAFLPHVKLPAHCFDIKQNIPLGIYGWGRGLGWFILGIADSYNELKKDHPEKEYLKQLILETANDTLQFQQENGNLNATLTVKGTRPESSITTLAGWLFFQAFTISEDPKFKTAAENCISWLMKVTRHDGTIDFCQGDTKGIGHYATTFEPMPFAQGLAIRLYDKLYS